MIVNYAMTSSYYQCFYHLWLTSPCKPQYYSSHMYHFFEI
jgi:hypothetical protein